MTWNPDIKTVIYRSRRSWHTKRNFEVFKATDFLAAAIEHIPPKGQQTIRYYGLYSNKTRGLTSLIPGCIILPPISSNQQSVINNHQSEIPLSPSPPKATARAMRPLWRDLILRVWGTDPLKCPCCQGTLRRIQTIVRPEEIQFFLRLLGLWEALISLPPPPEPPFDVEKRRGIGGVLDAGEAGARRVSPPCGAGESNLRTHPPTLASHPRLDPSRRRRSATC